MNTRVAAIAMLAILLFGARVEAFTVLGSVWSRSPVNMHLGLGAPSTALTDGSASFDAVASSALARWNARMVRLQLQPVLSTKTPADDDGVNDVFFSRSIYGSAFGDAVAVTTEYSTLGGERLEADVIFNSNLTWDSYRGPLRGFGRGTVYDFYRVALHEFGHVLGLNHPDEAGQAVVAIMNSFVSSTDDLQADDVRGAHSLYGAPDGDELPPEPAAAVQVLASGDISRPERPNTVVRKGFSAFRGTADASLYDAVFFSNSRLGKNRLFRAKGVGKWRFNAKLKRGRNSIIIYCRTFDGEFQKLGRRVLIFLQP